MLHLLDTVEIWEKRIGVLFSFAVYQYFYLLDQGEYKNYYCVNIETGECSFIHETTRLQGALLVLKIKSDPYKYEEIDILNGLQDAFSIYMNKVSN